MQKYNLPSDSNEQKLEQLREVLNNGVDRYENLVCDEMLSISKELDKYILIESLKMLG